MSSNNGFNLFSPSVPSTIPRPAPVVAYNGFNEFGSPENGLSPRTYTSGVSSTRGYNEFGPPQSPVPVIDGRLG